MTTNNLDGSDCGMAAKKVRHIQVSFLTFSLTATFAASSCTSDGGSKSREYAIPNPLCGITLEDDLYSAIYPPGQEVSLEREWRENSGGYLPARGECIVNVDDVRAIVIDVAPSTEAENHSGVSGYLAREGAYLAVEDHQDYKISNSGTVIADPHEVRAWQDFAVSHVPCATSTINFTGINVSIYLEWLSEGQDYSDLLANATKEFAESFVSRLGPLTCTA